MFKLYLLITGSMDVLSERNAGFRTSPQSTSWNHEWTPVGLDFISSVFFVVQSFFAPPCAFAVQALFARFVVLNSRDS